MKKLIFLIGGLLAVYSLSNAQTTTTQTATTQPDLPTVTLHLANVPRRQALDAFAKAGQLHIQPPDDERFWNADATVSIDLDHQPFWEALQQFQKASGLGFAATNQPEQFTPTHDHGTWGWTTRPAAVCGPMLLAVHQVVRRTALYFQDPSAAIDELSMAITVMDQPGVDWNIDDDGLSIESLKTDQNVELLAPGAAIHGMTLNNVFQLEVQFSTRLPRETEAAKKIKWLTLSGQCRGVIGQGEQKIEIADAENKPTDIQIAGYPVHITTKRNGQQIEILLMSKMPAGGDAKAFSKFGRRLWTLWGNRLRLLDANGADVSSNSAGTEGGPRDVVGMHKNYPLVTAPAPLRIEWTVPTSVYDATLPVKIEKIPVP